MYAIRRGVVRPGCNPRYDESAKEKLASVAIPSRDSDNGSVLPGCIPT